MLLQDMSVEEKLNCKATEAVMYNYNSVEGYNDAKILCGSPNGIANFNETPHRWAIQLFKNMRARDWSPERITIIVDKANYPKLPPVAKRAYRLVLAQLITNDSVQTQQLSIGISNFITSPIVQACLARQAFEEAVHSLSYTVLAEDVCNDPKSIYHLHEVNTRLFKKNQAVADMYSRIYGDKNNNVITIRDVLLAFVANQILEELVFPGGFALMYSLESTMKGTTEMIGEIHKDESHSHVPLFKKIFRTAIYEIFNNGVMPQSLDDDDHVIQKLIPPSLKDDAHKAIEIMADAEKEWTKYITNVRDEWKHEVLDRDVFGNVTEEERSAVIPMFSSENIDIFVESQANSVCKNLGLPLLYPEVSLDKNPLRKLVKQHLNYAREGVFETKGKEYAKNVELGF